MILAEQLNITHEEVEKIRTRFSYLEPSGVGAKDTKESYLFQLEHFDIEEHTNRLIRYMIEDLKNINAYSKDSSFRDAIKIIKRLKNIPAISNENDQDSICPDLVIEYSDEDIIVSIPSGIYPEIKIKDGKRDSDILKQKFKEAKHLIDLLELRKSTLYKIGLYVAIKQKGFFMGGELSVMGMDEIAQNIGISQSSISRAVSGKYIATQKGVFLLRDLFKKSLSGNLTKDTICKFIDRLIKGENRSQPLSDEEISALINREYNINLSRRSISKYRESLHVMTSRERRRYYALHK